MVRRKPKPPCLIASPRSMRRIADIDKSYQGHYAALTKPEPLNVAYVQALLAADEALLLVFDTRE